MEIKKAIVTGGSRGIGRGIAYKLAEAGYDIAINYSTASEAALEVKKNIEDIFGRRCFVYQASLEKRDAGQPFIRQAAKDLGGLDLLVNNAGVTLEGSILDMEIDKIDYLINLNFRTYLLNMQTAARYMIKRGIKGNIVNITSSRGERAYPEDSIYGGIKAALNRAIQSAALDLAPLGIRVNNIAPGAIQVRTPSEILELIAEAEIGEIDTSGDPFKELGDRIPLARIGQPSDIGDAVIFLASDKASYITGTTLRIDGGLILAGMPEWMPQGVKSTYDLKYGGRQQEFVFTDED